MATVNETFQRSSELSIYQMFERAIRIYSEKFKAVQSAPRITQIRTPLEDDIAKHIQSASILLGNMGYAHASLEDFLDENAEVMRCALTCYIAYLENGRELVWKELGAKPELRSTTKDIELAKEILGKLRI